MLFLCTSNITGAIDIAFLDRADLKLYVGPPSLVGRYNVLAGCIEELARVGLVSMGQHKFCSYKTLAREQLLVPCSPSYRPHESYGTSIEVRLSSVAAGSCEGIHQLFAHHGILSVLSVGSCAKSPFKLTADTVYVFALATHS